MVLLSKGKLIVNTCIDPVVQIEDSAYAYLGEVSKTDSAARRHVFTVNNICDFQKAELEEGDTFYFSVIPNPQTNGCAVCHLLANSPATRLNIKVKD
jgi:hypothetical protein